MLYKTGHASRLYTHSCHWTLNTYCTSIKLGLVHIVNIHHKDLVHFRYSLHWSLYTFIALNFIHIVHIHYRGLHILCTHTPHWTLYTSYTAITQDITHFVYIHYATKFITLCKSVTLGFLNFINTSYTGRYTLCRKSSTLYTVHFMHTHYTGPYILCTHLLNWTLHTLYTSIKN